MSNNKVHSKGQVPFAWENQPGIRKKDMYRDEEAMNGGLMKLPPPPVQQPEGIKAISVDLQNIPLPPCTFLPPISRNGSKRDVQDDPFLAAYNKCTNSRENTGRRTPMKKKNGVYILSCKRSCSVRDDSIVRISQLPIQRPQ
ncbi:Pre-mRNA-processing protein [Heracleum sosnowskyi]|uniref:Pre-mRNA-processing protein n=1 Tax=Heracleum sosnowskyi TaxID=360622 RepID=A0AAD8HGS9_9APIA|nr:Pre-mRNA-processing protein [Heracleum sosnowskyi]